jgi:drug/metabolite transporter (DMT)-like permease
LPYQGEIAALTAVFLWSSTAILFETIGKRIGAFNANLLRLTLASIFLCVTLFIQYGFFFPVAASSDQKLWLGLSGVVGLALGDAALFSCLVILGPRLATLLLSLSPVFATALAWFFLGEHLGLMALSGIAITFFGIYWVVNEKSDEHHSHVKMKGIILGILAALGQGAGVILAKYGFRTEIDALSATILRMIPATLVMWLAAIVLRKLGPTKILLTDKKTAWYILIASIIGPYWGVWLANIAVKYAEAGIAATLLATVPVILIPMIWFVRGTRPTVRALAGTVIAMAGVALIFLR